MIAQAVRKCMLNLCHVNVRCVLWIQLIAATHAANLSAGGVGYVRNSVQRIFEMFQTRMTVAASVEGAFK